MIKKRTDEAWNNLYIRLKTDGLLEERPSRRHKRAIRPTAIRWVASVAILCLCAAAVFVYQQKNDRRENSILVMSNMNNEATLVSTLEDGSTVYLSNAASLHYPKHFEKTKREVYLDGDAFFDIYRNQTSPFFIETAEVRVRVLGTSFCIQTSEEKAFRLSVERGKVLVTRKRDDKNVQVEAGQTIILDADHIQKEVHLANVFFKYKNRIYFKDEKLPDLVRVINQFAEGPQIELDKGLDNRRLNYAYVNDSTEAVSKIICLALGLQYKMQDHSILISMP